MKEHIGTQLNGKLSLCHGGSLFTDEGEPLSSCGQALINLTFNIDYVVHSRLPRSPVGY